MSLTVDDIAQWEVVQHYYCRTCFTPARQSPNAVAWACQRCVKVCANDGLESGFWRFVPGQPPEPLPLSDSEFYEDPRAWAFAKLLIECRDALPLIPMWRARMENVSLSLADRIDHILKPYEVTDDRPADGPTLQTTRLTP